MHIRSHNFETGGIVEIIGCLCLREQPRKNRQRHGAGCVEDHESSQMLEGFLFLGTLIGVMQFFCRA